MKMLFAFLIPIIMYANRDIYIFYNTAGNELKTKQIEELNTDKPGLQERDITVHVLNTNEAITEVKKWKIDTKQAFTFLLVGKDGGEKLRSKSMVTKEKLFSIIDAMPMRQAEMKQK